MSTTLEVVGSVIFLFMNVPYLWNKFKGNWRHCLEQSWMILSLIAVSFTFVDVVDSFKLGTLCQGELLYPILFPMSILVQFTMICMRLLHGEINGYGPDANDPKMAGFFGRALLSLQYAFYALRVASLYGIPLFGHAFTGWFSGLFMLKVINVLYFGQMEQDFMYQIRKIIFFFSYYMSLRSLIGAVCLVMFCDIIPDATDKYAKGLGKNNCHLMKNFCWTAIYVSQYFVFKTL